MKTYFGDKLNRSKHALKPIHQQELDQQERSLISDIAHEIVHTQQNNSVISAFNLASTLLSNKLVENERPYLKDELIVEMKWLKDVMEVFGALVSNSSLEEALTVHRNLIGVDENGNVVVVHNSVDLSTVHPSKLKGHALSNETMTNIVPMIALQIYINPCLHFLVNCCLIVVILRSVGKNREIYKGIKCKTE